VIPKLLTSEVKDEYARENFKRLNALLEESPLLKGEFKFFELVLTGAVTNLSLKHNLGFQPKDILQTSVTEGVTVTWKYASFTPTDVVLTTSAACTIRVFIGRYEET
jgi:hypothetical protein